MPPKYYYSHELGEIENATALINPISTNNSRGLKRLERLEAVAPFKIRTINTSIEPEINKLLIRAALESSDLLLVVAGDGTFNAVVRTIISNNLSAQAKQTPVWSLGGGNAEDGTRESHTRFARSHPGKALPYTRSVSAYPICFEVKPPFKKPELYPAAFYATLGTSALIASEQYLNKPSHRSSRLGKLSLTRPLSEISVGLKGLSQAGLNRVESESGVKEFYDEGFINSHLMAKYFRFPTRLTRPEAFHYVAPNIYSFLGNVSMSLAGLTKGDYFGPDDSFNFKTTHDLYAQFDGESEKILAGSSVDVYLHDQPLNLIVTNPRL